MRTATPVLVSCALSESSSTLAWSFILLFTALALVLVVATQTVVSYYKAYLDAPRQVTTFIDAVDASIQEDYSCDRDVAGVQQLDDRFRLRSLLRGIRKESQDLRKALDRLVIDKDAPTLHTFARFLWAAHRRELEERVRRLDLLRMRYLVVYMGIITASAAKREERAEKAMSKSREKPALALVNREAPPPAGQVISQAENIEREGPPRNPATPRQSIGHKLENVEPLHRVGWVDVVQELSRSPTMQKRHASIETAMRSPPLSPVSSSRPSPRPETPLPRKLAKDRDE